MLSKPSFVALGVVLGAWALAMPTALAHDPHAHHQQAATQPVAAQSASVTLADTPLLDQDGRSLRFKSDVVGERIVIVDFIYTTCTTVCPVVSATLAQVQGQLGDRLGRDVALLSVTVDPLRDTPARLKDYGARIGSGPGWHWLTGAKPQVDDVLRAFGAYTPNFVDHPPLVLVGDAKTGQWLRFYGFPSAEQLVKAVTELTATRAKTGAAG